MPESPMRVPPPPDDAVTATVVHRLDALALEAPGKRADEPLLGNIEQDDVNVKRVKRSAWLLGAVPASHAEIGVDLGRSGLIWPSAAPLGGRVPVHAIMAGLVWPVPSRKMAPWAPRGLGPGRGRFVFPHSLNERSE